MDFTSEEQNGVSTLVPYLSADKMGPFFDEIADEVATKPVNATFDSDGNKAWVVPGVPGEALDRREDRRGPDGRRAQDHRADGRGGGEDHRARTSPPKRPRPWASRTSWPATPPSYGGTSDRQDNVRITTEYASDVMLAPGQRATTSTRPIGPRTAERGYKLAPGIVGPGKLEDVLGGGICQVSTTLFNAAFFAGLKIVERQNHSIYIDHYPKGRDATVTGGAARTSGSGTTPTTTSGSGARPTGSPRRSTSTAPTTAAR